MEGLQAMDLPKTMLHILQQQVAKLGDRPALWSKNGGSYQPISWRDYGERVKRLALGLHQLGLSRGGALTIWSFNREEWIVAEFAAMAMGGVAGGAGTPNQPEEDQKRGSHPDLQPGFGGGQGSHRPLAP